MTLQEELRDACTKLRRTPMPVADVIPLLQRAAGALDAAQQVMDELRGRLAGAQVCPPHDWNAHGWCDTCGEVRTPADRAARPTSGES